jgi:hypothetical protein
MIEKKKNVAKDDSNLLRNRAIGTRETKDDDCGCEIEEEYTNQEEKSLS